MATQSVPSKRSSADESKFPGGKVPTKMPPKRIGGRVATARSKKLTPPPSDDADS